LLRERGEISRFYGIVIRMFNERSIRHHRPHFHAYYQEWSATFDIDTLSLLAGRLPVPQRRLVEAWATIHHDELLENWRLLNSGQPSFKIEPLV
jgi:hypothetical protein